MEISKKMVAQSIDWLGEEEGSALFSFDQADWSEADDDGLVKIEGSYGKGDGAIYVKVRIEEIKVYEYGSRIQ